MCVETKGRRLPRRRRRGEALLGGALGIFRALTVEGGKHQRPDCGLRSKFPVQCLGDRERCLGAVGLSDVYLYQWNACSPVRWGGSLLNKSRPIRQQNARLQVHNA